MDSLLTCTKLYWPIWATCMQYMDLCNDVCFSVQCPAFYLSFTWTPLAHFYVSAMVVCTVDCQYLIILLVTVMHIVSNFITVGRRQPALISFLSFSLSLSLSLSRSHTHTHTHTHTHFIVFSLIYLRDMIMQTHTVIVDMTDIYHLSVWLLS